MKKYNRLNRIYHKVKWRCEYVTNPFYPQVGGYCVQYEGGYTSWSPAKEFEEGYTLIK